MRIAIVGTGIAGLTCAHHLHDAHDVTLFEAGDHVGGHTNTVPVPTSTGVDHVDTGFIVYNERNYPNFSSMLDNLGVATKPTEMSFSVSSADPDFEYKSTGVRGLFAQRRNLVRPEFHRMLRDVTRFWSLGREWLRETAEDAVEPTLRDWLDAREFSDVFVHRHIIPVGAAIWSTDPHRMGDYPARPFLAFFQNHGMLEPRNRPQWRVVQGGSYRYVERLIEPFRDRIALRTRVVALRRHHDGVSVTTAGHDGRKRTATFDHVIVAAHGDQALGMLTDPTPEEANVLGAFRFQRNETVLHTDTALLPRRRRAWASWNFHLPGRGRTDLGGGDVSLTYDMTRLQGLAGDRRYCVTLNGTDRIDPDHVLRRLSYMHPVFDAAAMRAQRRHHLVNGASRTWFCGAYWGHGFHEDGVVSALDVVRGIRARTSVPAPAEVA